MQKPLRHFLFCASTLAAAASALPVHAQELLGTTQDHEILLYVGEVKSLPIAQRIKRVAIGNGKLFTSNITDNNQLLLIGEGAGTTSLILWGANGKQSTYTVRVTPRDAAEAKRVVTELLGDIQGIRVNQVGGNVIISGAANTDDVARINSVVKMYPQAVSLVREDAVSMKKMVYMKVQIIEIKKSVLESLGVQWPGSISGPMLGFAGNFGSLKTNPGVTSTAPTTMPLVSSSNSSSNSAPPTGGLRTYLGLSSFISTTINMSKDNGDAYVLAEPELSARSGGEAKFLAGGQVPLPSSSAFSSSVEFKDYGIRLNISPTADDRGNIRAKIETEISSIDPSVAVQNIPGFLTRQSNTEVNVKDGQTIVMAGLVDAEMSNDASRVPGLGSLPVLGRLFRSDSFKSGRTDIVILVTPTIIDPDSTINRERVEKGINMQEEFQRKLKNQDFVD